MGFVSELLSTVNLKVYYYPQHYHLTVFVNHSKNTNTLLIQDFWNFHLFYLQQFRYFFESSKSINIFYIFAFVFFWWIFSFFSQKFFFFLSHFVFGCSFITATSLYTKSVFFFSFYCFRLFLKSNLFLWGDYRWI